jgi:transposase
MTTTSSAHKPSGGTARSSRTRSRKARGFLPLKPQGKINHRVQTVGPEHFGIVAIDCGKARSKWMLCDFYGNVFIEPTFLEHTQSQLQAAIVRIRQACQQHQLRDLVVAIERTGTYHQPVYHAFRQAGMDTRLVHPLTSKQFRQPADPGNKTDDTDLAAIFRATGNGFGLIEPDWPDDYQKLQVLARQRRELVRKTSILRCQIRETLHLLMPGYAEQFGSHFFDSPVPLLLARGTGSAQAVLAAGLSGLRQLIPQGIDYRTTTLKHALDWAPTAPPCHPQGQLLRAQLDCLDDDRLAKSQQIHALEQQLAHVLAGTPYILLLALPGINVVSASELAGELGPIEHYADANHITGRAGLAPCRYQSNHVDHANGPLRRRGHRRLRAILMQIADQLLHHNHYYHGLAQSWKLQGKDPRWMHVKVAKAFTRLAFVMLAQRSIMPHPACQPRDHLLEKLLAFHQQHHTPLASVLDDLQRVHAHMPARAGREETDHLQQLLDEPACRRSRGPVALSQLIPIVLAQLGVTEVQSSNEGQDPD